MLVILSVAKNPGILHCVRDDRGESWQRGVVAARRYGFHKRMALTHAQKDRVTKEVKRHEKDTGSPEYQIAMFTEKIKRLTSHLKKNKQDFHSRRGLLKMVSKRKKLFTYLESVNEKSAKTLRKSLGL